MNRETFLNQLAAELAILAPADRKQVLDYYNEMILDGAESGIPEEEAVAELESPEQIAAQVRAEYGARQQAQARYGAQTAQEAAGPLEYVFSANGPRRMEVRASNTRIELRRAQDGRLRVLAYGCREEWLTPEVDDEVFRLTLRVPIFYASGWFMLMTGVERRKLVVELPEGFADGVKIKTSNAPITGEGLRLEGTARLNTSCGHIALERCRFDKLKADTSNSTMTLSDLAGQTCRAQTTNGHIKAEDCHFAKRLLLNTTNAPLRVTDIEAPVISLTTTNGAIKGWVRGRESDYAVTSGTSNARNELRDTSDRMDRPCRLRAETSNAKIRLTFAESEDAQEEAAWENAPSKEKRRRTEKTRSGLQDELEGLVDELQGLRDGLADELQGLRDGLADELQGLKDELKGLQDELQDQKNEQEDWEDDLEDQEDEEEDWEDDLEDQEDEEEDWEDD